ncbi:hypothetical protein Pan97_24920 [Bremerella volcania]|uniref:Transmembrane protein n=1 Tax=Bremerella volcania TaxID=2527984 RepID=A0A518C8C6_9BACT|nr:hypothetical protein Pan97_24920 [Bremerella volcania]
MFVVHPWNLVVTEAEVVLVPRPVPWGGIGVFCALFILFCGLMAVPVLVWGEPDQRWSVVALFSLFAASICLLATTVIYFSYRAAENEGPPLLVDRVEQMVRVSKHNLSLPIDQVDHLQVRNDMPDDDGKFRAETNISELILVVRDETEPKRYPLMVSFSCDYYDTLAREIAQLNLLPVKRVKGVPGSTLVYEKWLTPTPDHAVETTGDHP